MTVIVDDTSFGNTPRPPATARTTTEVILWHAYLVTLLAIGIR
ncbi:MAG: hypothetical protein ACOCPT_00995 [Halanaeroarchaeum sp.]